MLKRQKVEVLSKAGHKKTEVARMSGVSLRSVKSIAQEETVVHVDDKAERNQGQIGRPSTVQNFGRQVVGILLKSPDLPSLEILRRVRSACLQRPGAVKGAPFLGAAERTLHGEDRCDRNRPGGEKTLVSSLFHGG